MRQRERERQVIKCTSCNVGEITYHPHIDYKHQWISDIRSIMMHYDFF
jgi:hypothetical protein